MKTAKSNTPPSDRPVLTTLKGLTHGQCVETWLMSAWKPGTIDWVQANQVRVLLDGQHEVRVAVTKPSELRLPLRGPTPADKLLVELRRLRDKLNSGEEDRDDPDAFVSRFEELDRLLSDGKALPSAWAVRKC